MDEGLKAMLKNFLRAAEIFRLILKAGAGEEAIPTILQGVTPMEKVKQLLKKKSHHIWTVSPDATVYEAIELMSMKEIGAVMVMEGARVVGMFSERDYLRNGILKGRLSKDTEVREIMTTDLVHVDPDASIQECMELMTTERVRHLPVMVGDHLMGIVSMGDLVKTVMDEQRFMIQQLESYISG